MKKSEKLIKLLAEKYGVNITNVQRTYAGKRQKASGAFVWDARIGSAYIGSQWPIAELLKAEILTFAPCEQGLAIYPD